MQSFLSKSSANLLCSGERNYRWLANQCMNNFHVQELEENVVDHGDGAGNGCCFTRMSDPGVEQADS